MAQRALLVGINKYRIPGSDLNGCVNDVTNIRDILLKYFGFDVNDIRVVIDERATKKNIMNRLRRLVADAKSGDRLLFHFSGHGSQIRDRDGDELKDQLDEILCPHDMDWDGTHIVDDELGSFSVSSRRESTLRSCWTVVIPAPGRVRLAVLRASLRISLLSQGS